MLNVPEIGSLASHGVIRDVIGAQLPPEAFTLGNNVRFAGDGVEKLGGRSQVFGTPGVAPHFALPVASASQVFWLYVSLTKGYVYDGSSHTNITRQTAAVDVDYTASNTRDWNGTLLGGVPILNNGADAPQFWATASVATKLADLTNWPASTTAKVMRAFGPYLLALNVVKTGTAYPHMVKWSHPADPGSIPASWDNTDPTYDAGEKDLPDVQAGVILDGQPLRGQFYIYKESSIWRVLLIGGQFIFSFTPFLETAGLLAPRCVAITGDGSRHVAMTQDDLIVHNGNSVDSVLTERYRRYLVNNIDTTNYRNSFLFDDPFRSEMIFCYPESGNTQPNKALIWNYRLGNKGDISECDINFRNAAVGTIESATADTWASVSGTWGTYTGPWSRSIRRKVVVCGTDATKFYQLDEGTTFDGTSFEATLQRVGLAVVGKRSTGEWIVDFAKQKQINRLWIRGSGGPITVRVGFQAVPEGSIVWSTAKSFDPSTQKYLDFVGSGKMLCFEFVSTNPFRLEGYRPELEVISEF